MSFLIAVLLFALLYFSWPRIQAWLVVKLLQRVQRRMTEAAGQQQANRNRNYRSTDNPSDTGSTSEPSASGRQKQELDDIEVRKFARSSSDDYVDFEELPRD
ncbi:DUF4834 family protein [Porphyromonas sp.]